MWKRRVRRVLLGTAIVLGAGVAIVLVDLLVLYATLPDVAALRTQLPRATKYMELRAEELGLPDATYRIERTELAQIAPLLVCAVIKAEDNHFFRHAGTDWAQLRKAIRNRIFGGKKLGASTIPQQLARNLFLGPEQTLHRKVREWMIARQLEDTFTKREMLALYLSVIEWGDGVWGIAAAARAHLGKAPAELDVFDALILTSMIAAPRRPLEGTNLDRAEQLQRRVLRQFLHAGLIDEAQYAYVGAQLSRISAALRSGKPLSEAIAAARSVAPPAAAPSATLIQGTEVLATECGYDREWKLMQTLQR